VTTAFDAPERTDVSSPGGLDQVFAKRLVEQMGGEFGFEQVPGKGSSVWFTVPAELAPRPALAPEPASKLGGYVLAVVHNGLSQRLLTNYLHEFGITCDLVSNGTEALKRLSSAAYDLVLLDMATPELDGMQTAEEIRRLQGPAAEIPVIALIWHATKDNREEYLAAGFDGYVAKPIRGRELHAALAAHLTPDDAERAPAANGAAAIENAP
jgi:CheY-like chemotaxis protein